jgi:hypothetical protein
MRSEQNELHDLISLPVTLSMRPSHHVNLNARFQPIEDIKGGGPAAP